MYLCRPKLAEPLIGRVVYRGNNNANANGGVSYANANNAPSNSNTNVGSRLNYNRNNNKSAYNNGNVFPPWCRGRGATATAVNDWKAERPRERVEFGRAAARLCRLQGKNVSKKSDPKAEGRKATVTNKIATMRREGHIIEEIVEYGNMSDSFDQVMRGTKRKKSRQGRYLLAHRDEVIAKLSADIASGTFAVSGYRDREIVEGGKLRKIQVLTMYDRIGVHAIMAVVDKHIRRRFIRTTSASIKERGMHDLLEYIRRDMKDDPEGTRFCYKFDIRKFYESVDQDVLKQCVRRVFKDRRLIQMIDGFITMMPAGISIGLRSSQGLGNLLLSVYLDHYLKDECGIRHFYRYCDDGVVLGKSKAELWMIRDAVHECVGKIGLEVKANERVFPTDEGIDFLGYVIYNDEHVELRKRIKKKMARKMHEVKSRKRRAVLTASFYGMAKHADCNKLFNKLTGKTMKSFKDLKVAYKPEDGKKRFPGAVVSIRELVNLPIVVKDFETGIKTEQGEDRCIVAIEQNGEAKKFFTNSEEMKNILAQIREMPDGFPFETTIKTETFGKGRTKYVFS